MERKQYGEFQDCAPLNREIVMELLQWRRSRGQVELFLGSLLACNQRAPAATPNLEPCLSRTPSTATTILHLFSLVCDFVTRCHSFDYHTVLHARFDSTLNQHRLRAQKRGVDSRFREG